MVQDLKTEIETIKKTQTEKMLEIEKLGKRSENYKCKNNQQNSREGRENSGVEDKLGEIESSTKETHRSNKSKQNIQEMRGTVKRPNLRIIGIA